MSTAAPAFVTYVINMDSATERMAHMDAELKRVAIPYIRQPGVVGMELPYPNENFSDWSYKYLHGRRWAPRELGCYLSHIQCLRNFLQTDAPYALILEDDVKLDDNIKEILESAIEHASDWNMLRLSSVNRGKWWSVRKLGSHSLAVCLTREKGAGGYLVDRKAAACMVKKLLPMRLAWDIAFDLEWFLGLKTLGIYPLPIQQNIDFTTQIQCDLCNIKISGGWIYLTVLPFRVFLEITRFIFRFSLVALFIFGWKNKP
jgi:glycosyl transferase family 25